MHLPRRPWKDCLTRWGRRRRRERSGRKPLSTRSLQIEPLEARELLAIVSISSAQDAAEGGADGYFRLSRTESADALTVYFEVDSYQSTAVNGTDCGYLIGTAAGSDSGSVSFSAGQATVDIPVTAVDDGLVEGDETLSISLTADSGYTLGSPDTATLTISDNDTLPEVTITATDATATEAGPTTGQFTVTRTGDTGSALTVYYSAGGTADYYMEPDYSGLPNFDGMGSGWVTIPAGSSSAAITITPTDDAAVESDETVTLTLSADAGYSVGTPDAAIVTITDNDTLPEVTIAATDATATEAGPTTGQFTVTRTGSTAGDLTVYYSAGGTADCYMEPDYSGLPNFVLLGRGHGRLLHGARLLGAAQLRWDGQRLGHDPGGLLHRGHHDYAD